MGERFRSAELKVSEKTDSKKKLIIEKATDVFASKGFRNVTMKDIVEACEISRGGLYLYYSSTEEVFLDVLKTLDEKESSGRDMGKMLEESSISELILWFIKEQKKEIVRNKTSLQVAKFEYSFYCKEQGKDAVFKEEFDTAVKVLQMLLERGVESGEISCVSPRAVASSTMYALEGLKLAAISCDLSEKKIDAELVYLMRQFMEV